MIFHLSGNSAEKTAALMAALNEHGQYELTDFDADILELFAADYATEQETAAEIKRVYQASDYIEDPHTAVRLLSIKNTWQRQVISARLLSRLPLALINSQSWLLRL